MQGRKTYTKFAAFALALTVICAYTYAQPVDIPDPNLRSAVREALNIADQPDVELTQALMREDLTSLRAPFRQVADLEGLQYATNITSLALDNNRIADLGPIATLTRLTFLRLHHNRIIDVSPLANLTQLNTLLLANNNIADVAPLANLANLARLELQNNRITDITPLENLTDLEHLDTHNNPIFDPDSPVVEIPDANLRNAIRETLNLHDGVPVNRDFMQQLTEMDAAHSHITDLTGLEHASSLTVLALQHNDISDLRALTPLVNLTFLHLHDNEINDISPLANLTKLSTLLLGRNNITDISPLANLTQLNTLRLANNNIVDVTPLAHLTSLRSLEIQLNLIKDHSPLDALTLSNFVFDQSCEIAAEPLLPRLQNKVFPSVFSAWGGLGWSSVLNKPHLPDLEQMALHDLYFCCVHQFGSNRLVETNDGWKVKGIIEEDTRTRDAFLAVNPNMIFLVEIRMRSERAGNPPADSPDWVWVKDSAGNIAYTSGKRRLINFTHPQVQDMIVQQAIAVSNCGLYDGIFFDWWTERSRVLEGHVSLEAEQTARDNILRRIRDATRPDFLILVNTNHRIIPRTARYINGGFMETRVPGIEAANQLEESVVLVEHSLRWLDNNTRVPRINAFEAAAIPTQPFDSPDNLRWVRATTALSLTHSNGYVLFRSSQGGHTHYWYDFWDADLGRPVGAKGQLYQETDGLYIREFTNGWAVYNHSGKAQVITLPEEVQGVASGLVNTEHALPNLDGEMYLKAVVSDQPPVTSKNPADVNGDGVVNILDLTLVAQAFGKDGLQGDVNGDGVVNVFDLVFVANQF